MKKDKIRHSELEKSKLEFHDASVHCLGITIIGGFYCMWIQNLPLMFVFLGLSMGYYEIQLRRFKKKIEEEK